MSQPATPTMLDSDTAYAHVHNQVYAPLFFEKLAADYNIVPQSDQEAFQMLTMAAQLRQAHEIENEKVASANGTILDAAGQHLSSLLGQPTQAAVSHTNLVEKAAANLARDPGLAAAILSLQAQAAGVTPEALYRL